jgi:hypothetical protein
MQKYEIGYYIKQDCITIPHRSVDNRLIGLRGRMLSEEMLNDGRKYMPLTVGNRMYNHQLMFSLYGLNHTKTAVKRLKKICIFESEKSVLKCEDYFGEDNFSVACCGSSISNYQRDAILDMGVEEVFIAFDKYSEKDSENEERIHNYQEKLLKLAKKFTPFVKTYILWSDNDLLNYSDSPADKGKEVLIELMKNKYEIGTTGGD